MAASSSRAYQPVTFWRQLWVFRNFLITISAPIILLPLVFVNSTPESKCAYGVLLMGVYWVTGALPVAITALLPMVIFPLLSLEKSSVLGREYLKNGTFLLLGGIILALSIERWNLHKRVALKVLLLVGSKPRWLLLGFMLTSGVLSMWISNTATSTMMIPIAKAVFEEISRESKRNKDESKTLMDEDAKIEGGVRVTTPDTLKEEDTEQRKDVTGLEKTPDVPDKFGKGLIICIAYSSSIGGIATLTGTLPNVVMKGQADELFKGEAGVNFMSWFYFACPLSLLCLFLAWIWLQFYYLGWRTTLCMGPKADESTEKRDAAVKAMLLAEYNKLGSITFPEWMVAVHFVILVALWLTREPGFCPGWADLFEHEVTDSLPSMLVAISLFIVPSQKPKIPFFKSSSDESPRGPRPPVMDWTTVQLNFPWSVVLLLGGGFALASACKTSGLSVWLAMKFTSLDQIPLWASSLVIGGVISLATEITSNTAVTSIFVPVMADMGVAMGVNPLYFMLVATITSSFAFILPVATPPNTIAFAYGRLDLTDMVAPGWVLNVVCLSVLVLLINTWGLNSLGLGEFPLWAEEYKNRLANETLASHGNSTPCVSMLM